MKKRLTSALTAFTMTASAGLSSFPAGSFVLQVNAAEAETGETSNGFTYEITEDDVTITGWTGDKETVTSLVVPDTIDGKTVTRLGQSSLEDMPLLTSIKLPSGLESMGVWALSGNTSLKEITIPKTLKKDGIGCGNYYGIGTRNSFSDTALETIILEDGIEAVPSYLCVYQDKLTKVVVPDSVTTVGYRAFGDADALTEIDLPSSVKTIEYCAFWGSDGFTTIDLPEGLETIERNAFESCDGLTEVKCPSTLKKLGNEAFYGCTSLESVEMNEGLEYLGGKMFRDCEKLKEVTVPSTLNETWSPFENSYVETVTIAEGMERIPNSLCANSVITTLNIPESVTDLGENLFNHDDAIKEFTIPAQVTAGKNVFAYSGLETISFAGKRTEIPERMFQYANSMKTINWPAELTTIGEYAFANNYGTESFHIPDTVTRIDNWAFSYCKALTDLHIPEKGCSVGNYVFSGEDALKSVTIPAGLIGEDGFRMFYGSKGLESVTFAEGAETILSECFRGCPLLSEINMPDTLKEIQSGAFSECTELRSVDIPDSVTAINSRAFSWCTALENVHLPENLETLGTLAFGSDSLLKGITIPKNIKDGGENCFEDSGVTDVWFEEGLENIPKNICSNMKNLKTAHIPGSVKFIGNQAFYKCRMLENLDMPFEAGDLIPHENYEYMTFYGCDSLRDIRVSVADHSATYINKIESTSGEGGLINYTVYYKLNPNFKDLFESGNVTVSTNSHNPILKRSISSTDTDGYLSNKSFDIESDKQEGVIRFSTLPEPDADTEVTASINVDYNNGYDKFSDSIIVDNENVGNKAVTIKAPQKAALKDGTATFNVVGYAHGSQEVTILADGEEAAVIKVNKYTGKYMGTVKVKAEEYQKIAVSAQSGENSSEVRTVLCSSSTVNIEKVILRHNTHTDTINDITDVFTLGASPYITYNPSHPLNFEVTLSDNDLTAVYVSSTVNGEESSIPLEFDKKSGTWKGEGFFATRVPGTLNINAVRDNTVSSVVKKPDGKLYINDHEFLGSDSDEKIPDISDQIIADTKHTITGDDDTIIATYDFSDILEEPSGIVHIETREKTISLNGSTVTPEDVIADPESYGFTLSPMLYTDEKGEQHRYLVRIVTDGEEMLDIMKSIPAPEDKDTEMLPLDPSEKKKAGRTSLYDRILNGLADMGAYTDTSSKVTSGSVVIDCPVTALTGDHNDSVVYDFMVTETTESGKGLLDLWAKAKDAKISKALGTNYTKYSDTLGYTGKTLTVLELGTHCTGMLHEMREIINSNDPRVQKHEDALLAVSIGTCMSKATLTLAGGAAIGATITSAAAVIAGGAAILPELLAVGAVIAGVWLVGKAIDGVSGWLKKVIIGDTKVENDGKMKYLIDPSGIAYEFLPSNPIEGVTAEIYYKDEKGKEILWNAVDYEQLNPQITDNAGWFAWDVPEGEWKVKLTAEGYESAESEWLPVLPVQVNINLNMTSAAPSELSSAEFNSSRATITFTKHMQDKSVNKDSLYLTDKDGKVIPAVVKAVKESFNDTDCSITYTLTPTEKTDLSGASVNLTSKALSYAGTASKAITSGLTQGEELPEEEYTLGDVNNDGRIDSSDATSILQQYSIASTGGSYTITEIQQKAADTNKDGKIDATDATNVLQYYSYISTGGTESFNNFLNAA